MRAVFVILSFFIVFSGVLRSQPIPAEDENIPHLVTFGKFAETSWGDDDFSQVFFFSVPENFEDPIYIRIYDPDCGGQIDEINGLFDTKTEFTIYGGQGCHSEEDAQGFEPVGNYKSGNLLASKTFGDDPRYDNNWYTFGPFNPKEGELDPKYGYVFKIIAEGVEGDDGNLYQYFLSTEPDNNVRIEGGNGFCYEYTFRMWNTAENDSHIYPYCEEGTVTVKQINFDWDDDGILRIVSVSRRGELGVLSGEDHESESTFTVIDDEIGTSYDFQFIKRKEPVVINNNVVISVVNQDGEGMKIFNIPIGGVPKYVYKIGVKKIENK